MVDCPICDDSWAGKRRFGNICESCRRTGFNMMKLMDIYHPDGVRENLYNEWLKRRITFSLEPE